MKLEFGNGWVKHSGGVLRVSYPVLEAREIDGIVVVVHDYMAFPKGSPARNLFAYSPDGTLRWRAEDLGQGSVDAYTNIISEQPLVVGNFSGFNCTLSAAEGRVLATEFVK